MDKVADTEHTAIMLADPTLEFIQCVLPEKETMFRGPHPFCNHFVDLNSVLSTRRDVALHITIRPDCSMLLVNEMQVRYNLPDLLLTISHYIHEASQC